MLSRDERYAMLGAAACSLAPVAGALVAIVLALASLAGATTPPAVDDDAPFAEHQP